MSPTTARSQALPRFARTTFPHPPGRRPLVGDLSGLPRTPVQTILRGVEGLGDICEFKAFRNRFVLVTTGELMAELCDERRFVKALPPGLVALRRNAGDGLFTAYNDETNWRLAHDLLLPAFARPAMLRYHATMLGAADELVSKWDAAAAADEPVDVPGDLTRLTLETISRCAFSKDMGSFTSAEVHPFVQGMVRTLGAGQRIAAVGSLPLVGRRLADRVDARMSQHREEVHAMIDGWVAERRSSGEVDDRDLLGIMLGSAHPETGAMLDDENIRHQIQTFLVAGHETTSGALSFALHYLSRDPQALAAAYAETDAVLGPDRDARPTFEQVPKLRHLRRCLDEALRLWPTAPAFARGPRETTVLGGRWQIEPGDWAMALLPAVHRDPAVWGDDAEEYRPDRFLPVEVKARPAHTYKPFGTGERACIGRQFALHEAVLVLARVLHRFEIEADPGYELEITERLTLMPRDLRLSLRPR